MDRFGEILCSAIHTLKRALTDPRLFGGIGNAYSNEILFQARLSPLKLTQALSRLLREDWPKTIEDLEAPERNPGGPSR